MPHFRVIILVTTCCTLRNCLAIVFNCIQHKAKYVSLYLTANKCGLLSTNMTRRARGLSIIVCKINMYCILKPQHKLECCTSLTFHRMQYIYTGNHSIQSWHICNWHLDEFLRLLCKWSIRLGCENTSKYNYLTAIFICIKARLIHVWVQIYAR